MVKNVMNVMCNSGDNICIECVCKKKVWYLINILSLYFLHECVNKISWWMTYDWNVSFAV